MKTICIYIGIIYVLTKINIILYPNRCSYCYNTRFQNSFFRLHLPRQLGLILFYMIPTERERFQAKTDYAND